ncbi:prepilin peptidase [Rathayibacter sp. KR2-224]|uniref:prepilin peptidase n=1 Tax=Rathayibacter sp. KR2-224 TaxID=3400913 RepID=UPI003C1260A0
MPLWRCAWQVPLAGALLVLCLYGMGPRFEAVGCLYLALVTPELCRVDLAEHRLPNALVLPGFAFASVGAVFGWLASGRAPTGAVLAVVVVGGFFALLAATGGLGMGDVKLGAVLALAGGAASVVVVIGAVVLGFVGAGVSALAVLAARGGAGNIAFGPYLLGGFWASVAGLPLFV